MVCHCGLEARSMAEIVRDDGSVVFEPICAHCNYRLAYRGECCDAC